MDTFPKTDPPIQTISDTLDRLEVTVTKIGQLTAQQAFTLLRDLDAVYLRMQALEPGSASRKTADAQFSGMLSKMKKEPARLLRDLGGAGELRRARGEANPPSGHEWWYLDEVLDTSRRAALKRFAVLGGAAVVLLVTLYVLYNRFLAPTPSESAAYLAKERATQQIQEGNFTRAREFIDQGLLAAPQDSNLLVLKGIVQEHDGQAAQAEQSFQAAQQGFPTREDFLLARGQVYVITNQLDRALTDAEAAIQLAPQSAGAFLLRAQALEGQQKYEAAMNDYNRAYEMAEQAKQTELAAFVRIRMAYLTQLRTAQDAAGQQASPTPAQ